MCNHDPVAAPSHYTVYPVQSIAISRHLSFCLGNVVKYVLRAPYKGGAEDLRKALQYLEWEMETPGPMLSHRTYARVEVAIDAIINHLVIPRNAMADMQSHILLTLDKYLAVGDLTILSVMLHAVQRMLDLQGQP